MKQKLFTWGIRSNHTDYNSNNAWGFGGARGILYTFNKDLQSLIGFAGTRHLGEFPFITVTHKGIRVFDASNTSANREQAKKLVKEIIKNDKQTRLRKRIGEEVSQPKCGL